MFRHQTTGRDKMGSRCLCKTLSNYAEESIECQQLFYHPFCTLKDTNAKGDGILIAINQCNLKNKLLGMRWVKSMLGKFLKEIFSGYILLLVVPPGWSIFGCHSDMDDITTADD
jgi:hypothetical protein